MLHGVLKLGVVAIGVCLAFSLAASALCAIQSLLPWLVAFVALGIVARLVWQRTTY